MLLRKGLFRRLRRVSAQEGKEGVACRVGSSTFLRHCDVVGVVIISSSSLFSSSYTSRSFSSSFWSQRVFARSSRLRRSSPVLPVPPLRGAACCSPPVLFLVVPSFRSARLNTLLRRYPPCFDPSSYPFFVHSLARLPRSRDLAFNDRSCVYTRSLFLPLWLGKQSARCLLSSHSTCLLTQASCPPRSISLVACA